MFKICAANPGNSATVTFSCEDIEVASRLCLDLYREGYTINRIALPSGTSIQRDEIERVINAGLNPAKAVREAVKRHAT